MEQCVAKRNSGKLYQKHLQPIFVVPSEHLRYASVVLLGHLRHAFDVLSEPAKLVLRTLSDSCLPRLRGEQHQQKSL